MNEEKFTSFAFNWIVWAVDWGKFASYRTVKSAVFPCGRKQPQSACSRGKPPTRRV